MPLSAPFARRFAVLSLVLLAAPLVLASPAAASIAAPTTETYTMTGYEIYFAADHAIFVGTGDGQDGARELSGWYTSVYHSVVVVPSGDVTGGTAFLQRIDGVEIQGDISGGEAVQTDPGDNCTTETHQVTAQLTNVTRTDEPGVVGTAVLSATLTHYHVMVFGTCYAYSASVNGTIDVTV
jgi:hypothetical protein